MVVHVFPSTGSARPFGHIMLMWISRQVNAGRAYLYLPSIIPDKYLVHTQWRSGLIGGEEVRGLISKKRRHTNIIHICSRLRGLENTAVVPSSWTLVPGLPVL